jgi:serine/threonine protein kinase/uncharacterized caspase-like protein
MSKHALLIGIDDYDGDPLAYCVSDARALRNVLEEPTYGFTCTLLENAAATTRNIKEQLEKVLRAGAELVVFYFAGHGLATDYGAYLITSDCKDRVDDGFDMGLLTRMVAALSAPAAAVVIILDCCQSGALEIAQGSSVVALRGDDLSEYVQTYSDRRVALAACKENQLAEEEAVYQHGVFTNFLLDGLTGGAADEHGEVTVLRLYDHVAQAFETHGGQRPVCRGDSAGRIVLGTGLLSKAARKTVDELEATERMAEEHLASLQRSLAGVIADRTVWHNQGFRTACKQATPIIEWFEHRKRERPELVQRDRFSAAEQELIAKVKALSQIEPGIKSEYGVTKKALGSGSFGTVWLVQSEHGPIAVKVYNTGDLGIPEKEHRFRQGFRAMRRLEHPRIVRVHSITECPLSFAMDYIEGANMRDWAGTIDDPQELLVLLQKIVDTLQHAHYRDVVHRDVKPENIIMKPGRSVQEWEPHLTDFDLAWFSTATIQTNDALGTVFYAAPEQLAKPNTNSSRSKVVDVYSIGQVFYYLLTKSNPVPMEMANNVRAFGTRLTSWGSVRPAELMVNLYQDCTRHNPVERIQSMEEVARRLFDVRAAFSSRLSSVMLTREEFVREVRFAIIGLADAAHIWEFMSPARLVKIALSFEDRHLSIGFQVSRKPLVDNVSDYRKGRDILNQRLETLLRNMPNVWRKSGRENPYEVFVNVNDLLLRFSEVAAIRDLTVKVLGVLEKG